MEITELDWLRGACVKYTANTPVNQTKFNKSIHIITKNTKTGVRPIVDCMKNNTLIYEI